jgi:hypothetical protein
MKPSWWSFRCGNNFLWGGVAETLDKSGCALRGRCLHLGIMPLHLVWRVPFSSVSIRCTTPPPPPTHTPNNTRGAEACPPWPVWMHLLGQVLAPNYMPRYLVWTVLFTSQSILL